MHKFPPPLERPPETSLMAPGAFSTLHPTRSHDLVMTASGQNDRAPFAEGSPPPTPTPHANGKRHDLLHATPRHTFVLVLREGKGKRATWSSTIEFQPF